MVAHERGKAVHVGVAPKLIQHQLILMLTELR